MNRGKGKERQYRKGTNGERNTEGDKFESSIEWESVEKRVREAREFMLSRVKKS